MIPCVTPLRSDALAVVALLCICLLCAYLCVLCASALKKHSRSTTTPGEPASIPISFSRYRPASTDRSPHGSSAGSYVLAPVCTTPGHRRKSHDSGPSLKPLPSPPAPGTD